jgi:hypothetical protein
MLVFETVLATCRGLLRYARIRNNVSTRRHWRTLFVGFWPGPTLCVRAATDRTVSCLIRSAVDRLHEMPGDGGCCGSSLAPRNITSRCRWTWKLYNGYSRPAASGTLLIDNRKVQLAAGDTTVGSRPSGWRYSRRWVQAAFRLVGQWAVISARRRHEHLASGQCNVSDCHFELGSALRGRKLVIQ